MTPEAQRIAIAKACGWQKTIDGRLFYVTTPNPDDPHNHKYQALDPINDLNAMHEAEKNHIDGKLSCRVKWLNIMRDIRCRNLGLKVVSDYEQATSSASERAEAFLKTLNLWTV